MVADSTNVTVAMKQELAYANFAWHTFCLGTFQRSRRISGIFRLWVYREWKQIHVQHLQANDAISTDDPFRFSSPCTRAACSGSFKVSERSTLSYHIKLYFDSSMIIWIIFFSPRRDFRSEYLNSAGEVVPSNIVWNEYPVVILASWRHHIYFFSSLNWLSFTH